MNPQLPLATIQGLQSRPELNGQTCEVLYHDPGSGRLVVLLQNDEEIKLKLSNLVEALNVPAAPAAAAAWGGVQQIPGAWDSTGADTTHVGVRVDPGD